MKLDRDIASQIIAAYKEHYPLPYEPSAEIHLRDCINSEIEPMTDYYVERVTNLAMMVRRMSYALKRAGTNDKLVMQSVELLRKYDLGGSILREHYTEG